ncbi:P-loop NTPase [uncultured Helicobacter sp.]|uniref:P-loop NTPase n=1 Tax=uncultured Helicobacter sp. TaxID=175537 RepID=UPI001C39B871|nr:P-loop NTPase [Candidatus Helicobacter avicola]
MQTHQASALQELVQSRSKRQYSATRFIAVTSGKGGVGKSTISANLAYALWKMGKKVAIFDADIGLANLDLIFGVKTPYNILHALRGEVSFNQVVHTIEQGLYLIPGDSGDEILKYANTGVLERFVEESDILDCIEYMIIDTGAGIGGITQRFLDASDMLIVVTMRDPSALTDAYATIKLNAKTKDDIALIINMAQNAKEAKTIYDRIHSVALEKIPSLRLHYLGFIAQSNVVSQATRARELFYKAQPLSPPKIQLDEILRQVFALESKLFSVEQNMLLQSQSALGSFFKRMLGYL